jgi:outer membrane lipoprotein carrier protein
MLMVAGLLLALAAPLTAQAAAKESVGLNDVIRALEGPFQADAPAGTAILDFEADFFQEATIASLDRVQRGRGRVAVKFDRVRGDRVPLAMFRWEYDQPTNQEIVSDGRTLWVYLPENRQVIQSQIDTVSQSRPSDPVTFLTGLGNLSRDFQIGWATPNHDVEGNYVLQLRPRRVSSLIRELQIVVNRDAVLGPQRRGGFDDVFPILSTMVVDPSGNTTLIEFSNIRTNRGLSATSFRFILPAGVEVVRPTGQEMGF